MNFDMYFEMKKGLARVKQFSDEMLKQLFFFKIFSSGEFANVKCLIKIILRLT
jgi:hypothetical protein